MSGKKIELEILSFTTWILGLAKSQNQKKIRKNQKKSENQKKLKNPKIRFFPLEKNAKMTKMR